MTSRATAVGLSNQSYFTNTQGHVSYFNTLQEAAIVIAQSAQFLSDIFCSQIPTGCKSPKEKVLFEVYPNPVRDEFSVQTSCVSEDVFVFDTMGRLVKTIDHTAFYKASLGDLPKGVYYLRLENHSETLKVIKY